MYRMQNWCRKYLRRQNFNVTFTEQAKQTRRVNRNKIKGSGYTCAELLGILCVTSGLAQNAYQAAQCSEKGETQHCQWRQPGLSAWQTLLLLPARRRPQGLVVIGVSVCLSVCAHTVCPQDISRTGSWITTKFGGWEQGWTSRTSSILVLIGFRMRIQDHFSISVNNRHGHGHGQRAGLCPPRTQ